MRTNAQVDHGTATIDGGRGAVRDLALDEMLLVFVVLQMGCQGQRFTVGEHAAYPEHLQEGLLGHHDALKLLLLLDSTFRKLLENRIVGVGDGTSVDGHLVEETVIRGRTNTQVASVVLFGRFTEDVGR